MIRVVSNTDIVLQIAIAIPGGKNIAILIAILLGSAE